MKSAERLFLSIHTAVWCGSRNTRPITGRPASQDQKTDTASDHCPRHRRHPPLAVQTPVRSSVPDHWCAPQTTRDNNIIHINNKKNSTSRRMTNKNRMIRSRTLEKTISNYNCIKLIKPFAVNRLGVHC